MADAARDELVKLIRERAMKGYNAEELADVLLSRSYRRSVTPDQIDDVARKMVRQNWGPVSAQEWDKFDDNDRAIWLDRAGEVARAFGLEVIDSGA